MQFYKEDYSYSKFITTPPGLYLLGKAYLHIFHAFNQVLHLDVDTDYHTYIRYMNSSVLGVINFVLLIKIIQAKYNEKDLK